LVLEDVAMLLVDPDIFQVFGHTRRTPLQDLLFRVQVLFLLFRLLSVDVREAVLTAILASRIVSAQVL
jgi:hypothetical protein